jgi:hypothetical protein
MATLLRSTGWRVFGLLAVLAAGSPGCQRADKAGATTVRGLVTFEGYPLAGGMIVFTPDPERGGSGKPLPAEIAADGRFQLAPAADSEIAPGWYRVAVAAPPPVSPPWSVSAVFPTQLARPDQSGLMREVKRGQENVFEFVVSAQQESGQSAVGSRQ